MAAMLLSTVSLSRLVKLVTSYDVRCGALVTSRAAVLWAHKNETIDVITSKKENIFVKFVYPCYRAEVWTGARTGHDIGAETDISQLPEI